MESRQQSQTKFKKKGNYSFFMQSIRKMRTTDDKCQTASPFLFMIVIYFLCFCSFYLVYFDSSIKFNYQAILVQSMTLSVFISFTFYKKLDQTQQQLILLVYSMFTVITLSESLRFFSRRVDETIHSSQKTSINQIQDQQIVISALMIKGVTVYLLILNQIVSVKLISFSKFFQLSYISIRNIYPNITILIIFVFFQLLYQMEGLCLNRDKPQNCISNNSKFRGIEVNSKLGSVDQKQRISLEAFQFFEQVLSHFSQGILVLDEELKIKQTNQSLLDIIKVYNIEEWLQDQRISLVMESSDTGSCFNSFLTAYLLYNDKFKYNLIDRNKNQFRIRNNLLINIVYDHFNNQSYIKSSQNIECDLSNIQKDKNQVSEIMDLDCNHQSQFFCQINNAIYKVEIHTLKSPETNEKSVMVIFTDQNDNIKYLDKKRKIKAINEQFNQLLMISVKNMNDISQHFNCCFNKSEDNQLIYYQINSQINLYKKYLKFIQEVFQVDQANHFQKKNFQQKMMKLLSLFYYQNQYFGNKIIFKHQKFLNMNISLDYRKLEQIILALIQINIENTMNGVIKVSVSVQDSENNLLRIKVSSNGNGFHLDLYQILTSQVDNKFDFFEHKDSITNQVSLKNYIRLCLVNKLLRQVAEKYLSFNYLNYLKNIKGSHFYFFMKAQDKVERFFEQQNYKSVVYKDLKVEKQQIEIDMLHYQKYHANQNKKQENKQIKQKPHQLKNLQQKKKKYFNKSKYLESEQSESRIASNQLKMLQEDSDLKSFILNGDINLNDISSIQKKQSIEDYYSVNTKNMILNFNKGVQPSIDRDISIQQNSQNTYQKQNQDNQESLELDIKKPMEMNFQVQKQKKVSSRLNQRKKLEYQKSDQMVISNSTPKEISESELSESIKMYYEINKCEHQQVQIVTDNNLCIQSIKMIYQKLNIKVNVNIVLDGYLNSLKNKNDGLDCCACENKFRYFLIDIDSYYIEQHLKHRMNNQINEKSPFVYLVDDVGQNMKQMISQSYDKIVKKPLTIEKVRFINSFYFL